MACKAFPASKGIKISFKLLNFKYDTILSPIGPTGMKASFEISNLKGFEFETEKLNLGR